MRGVGYHSCMVVNSASGEGAGAGAEGAPESRWQNCLVEGASFRELEGGPLSVFRGRPRRSEMVGTTASARVVEAPMCGSVWVPLARGRGGSSRHGVGSAPRARRHPGFCAAIRCIQGAGNRRGASTANSDLPHCTDERGRLCSGRRFATLACAHRGARIGCVGDRAITIGC